MSFAAIIEAHDPSWADALPAFAHYDFHHLPAYVALEAARRGGQACAFIYRDGASSMLVPFVQSPVPLTLQPRRVTQSDALSPYGYAGPLVTAAGSDAEQNAFVTAALAQMVELLRKRNICTIFIRFHPLILPPLAPFRALGSLVLHGETVSVNLRQTEAELWTDTRKTFRNSINQIERAGYVFEIDTAAQYQADFLRLYRETMRRVGAAPEYFFPARYFQQLQQSLGSGYVLAHVRGPDGSIVSSGLFTICTGIVQYHLNGNSLDQGGSEASKLLLHKVRSWAREQGYEQFHLGGGVGARKDNLFLFKSGLGSGRVPFYSWRLIVDEVVCAALCRQWEKVNQEPIDALDGFFPPYRKPAVLYRSIAQRNE
jgi:hypothetical protein